MDKFKLLNKKRVALLPKTAGVYCFKKGKNFLYIGKATNIKERAKNHFSPRRSFSEGEPGTLKDSLFTERTSKVGYIKTDSEIEALILEAKLIKKYQPKYNIAWRDNKNYFFAGITKEDFPQVFITHQTKVQSVKRKTKNENLKLKTIYIGPFVDGMSLKQTLKALRKVFPYRTCRALSRTPCLWYQLDRCPAPCLLKSSFGKQLVRFTKSIRLEKGYKRNIQKLIKVLQGKKTQVLKDLKKEMKTASGNQDFETAAKIRDRIQSLEKVMSHARIFEEREPAGKKWGDVQKILQKILRTKKSINRIEAYDISNIQGKEATGSLVTFSAGQPDKNFYRKFKIRADGKPNDTAMLKEVLRRRFSHPEWPSPDLVLIDGGKPQLNAALKVKSEKRKAKNILVMALAKKENKLFIEGRKKSILLKNLPREIFNLILQIRDEAHRFALSYHRKLREKGLLKK